MIKLRRELNASDSSEPDQLFEDESSSILDEVIDPHHVVPSGPDQAGIYAQLATFPPEVREQVMKQFAAQRAAADAQAAVVPEAEPAAPAIEVSRKK